MSTEKISINALLGDGGAKLNDGLRAVLQELQGFTQVVVTGAAAGVAMAVDTIRDTDHICGAVVYTNAGGAPVDGKANITAQSVRAQGTVTLAAVLDGDTFTTNDTVYTFKATPTAATDVRLAGTNAENAAKLVKAINDHENRRVNGSPNLVLIKASAVGAVVTIRAVREGVTGNDISLLSSNNTRLAVTAGGKLSGGTSIGSIKSTDNLTGKTIVLSYYSKPVAQDYNEYDPEEVA